MEKIKVLVAVEDSDERLAITDTLSSIDYITIAGEVASYEKALEMIESSTIDVVLVNADIPGDGYKLSEAITLHYPEVISIIIETELKEETLRKSLFAGAKDVLIHPFTPSKLVDSIYRSFQKERKRSFAGREKAGEAKKIRNGQILSVFSNKGGVGKTFVATNLAVTLAQFPNTKVALVDFDLEYGNCAIALNLIPHYSISDIINDIRHLDKELLESYLIPHKSGVKLLASSSNSQLLDYINTEHISLILKILQNSFDYIIIDMPSRLNDKLDYVFQESDLILLITGQEVTTISNIKACLMALSLANYPKSKIKLLLNKLDSKNEVKPKDIETTLNHQLYSQIPADYKIVSSSMNRGIPLPMLFPNSKVNKSILSLAKNIVGSVGEASTKEIAN